MSWNCTLNAACYDPVVCVDPGPNDLKAAFLFASRYLALFDNVILAKNEEILAELFLPTRLYPFDAGILADSLAKSRKLLVVEEGQGFVSLSSEILAQVAERFGHLNVRCRRLTASGCPIPSARPLEEQCLPNTDAIVRKASELVREPVQ